MSFRERFRRGRAVTLGVQNIPRSLMYGLLDAEIASSVTVTGSGVSAWVDQISGRSFVQATDGARPPYSATSFNGRPGITFDGAADFLRNTSAQAWPLSGAFEVWALVDFLDPAPAAAGVVMEYPVQTTTSRFRMSQAAGGANLSAQFGDGTATYTRAAQPGILTGGATVGRHVMRAISTGTTVAFEADGARSVGELDCVASFGATLRNTIGGSGASTPTGFANMVANCIAVTRRLPDQYAAIILSDFNTRRGVA